MSDIASQITQILNSEEGMNKLKAVADSLGLGNVQNNQNSFNQTNNNSSSGGNFVSQNNQAPPQTQNSQMNVSELLGSLLGGNNNQNSNVNNPQQTPSFDPSMLLKLQGVMSQMNTNDNNTQLLLALKGHLSEARQKKVDDAIKIMQLIKILPVIKDLGLFGGDSK